jgi:hypothetical protein
MASNFLLTIAEQLSILSAYLYRSNLKRINAVTRFNSKTHS